MADPHRIRDLAVSETGFIFDPVSGATFTANATALTVLEGLRQGLSRGAIVALLEERFEVGSADVQRDLDELLHLLRRDGLLPPEFRL